MKRTNANQTSPEDNHHHPAAESLATFLIVAACSIFFCSKGVFIKSAYHHGADPITVLALRMAYALPVFAVVAWISGRVSRRRLSGRQWAQMALLGFVGYYVSALVNFTGLQYVSVGLERMVLYSYPSLVLLGSALFLGAKVRRATVLSMLIAYAGIVVAYFGEATVTGGGKELLGVLLVFASAVTYAIFVVGSGKLLREIGAARFTANVVGISCVFMLVHYLVTHSVGEIGEVPLAVHGHAAVLAVFGTLVPSFLLGIGLKRAGAQKFAIIGTVGPLATVVMAWLVLGEVMNGYQVVGFLLTMIGGVSVSLCKMDRPRRRAREVEPVSGLEAKT